MYIGNNSIQHSAIGVCNPEIQQKDQTICWHLRCTVTKGFYVSVGQSEKQTVDTNGHWSHVTNSELKRICYKEPFRGNSDCLATYRMQDGGQQEVKDTDVWNCRWNE